MGHLLQPFIFIFLYFFNNVLIDAIIQNLESWKLLSDLEYFYLMRLPRFLT